MSKIELSVSFETNHPRYREAMAAWDSLSCSKLRTFFKLDVRLGDEIFSVFEVIGVRFTADGTITLDLVS